MLEEYVRPRQQPIQRSSARFSTLITLCTAALVEGRSSIVRDKPSASLFNVRQPQLHSHQIQVCLFLLGLRSALACKPFQQSIGGCKRERPND